MARIAVVGCGYWGVNHVRVYRNLLGAGAVVAVDPDQQGLNRIRDLFPEVEVSTDYASILDKVDAVVLATPPKTHASLAEAALRAGCHVLVEKPLACSTVEAEGLIVAAHRAGVILMTGHTFEYNPAVWKLRDIVRSGELGQVCHIDAARLNLGRYQSDVNVFWDLAPHDISIMNYLLDAAPTSVMAWGRHNEPVPLEDIGCLRLEYGDIGVSGQVHVSWLDPRKVRRVTVVGTKKMAVYDDLDVDERIKIYDKSIEFGNDEPWFGGSVDYHYGGTEAPYIDFDEPLKLEGQAFLAAIATGTPPQSDGWNGLNIVRVLEAADESLRLKRPVEIAATRPSVVV